MTKEISDTIGSTTEVVKDWAKKSVKTVGVSVGRKLGYETKENRDRIDQTNKTLSAGRDKAFDTAEQKTAEQMSALTSGKLNEGESWQDALKNGNTEVKDIYERTLKRNFDIAASGDSDLSKALKERGMDNSKLFDSSYFNLQQTSSFGGLLSNFVTSSIFNRSRTLDKAMSRAMSESDNDENNNKNNNEENIKEENGNGENNNENDGVLNPDLL